MKTVILAGGFGTRLAEETDVRPKPMVEIGERPILWHIMKHYAHYGVGEFVVPLGYLGDVIRRYFLDYSTMRRTISVDLASGQVELEDRDPVESWRVHLVETGDPDQHRWTGPAAPALAEGRGVLPDLRRRRQRRRPATGCAPSTRPRGASPRSPPCGRPSRFGGLELDGDAVATFIEKPEIGEGWINGGFMVLEPGVFDYLDGPDVSLEHEVLRRLAEDGQLSAFRHTGFWQSMDTLRDVRLLQSLWRSERPPWKVWS